MPCIEVLPYQFHKPVETCLKYQIPMYRKNQSKSNRLKSEYVGQKKGKSVDKSYESLDVDLKLHIESQFESSRLISKRRHLSELDRAVVIHEEVDYQRMLTEFVVKLNLKNKDVKPMAFPVESNVSCSVHPFGRVIAICECRRVLGKTIPTLHPYVDGCCCKEVSPGVVKPMSYKHTQRVVCIFPHVTDDNGLCCGFHGLDKQLSIFSSKISMYSSLMKQLWNSAISMRVVRSVLGGSFTGFFQAVVMLFVRLSASIRVKVLPIQCMKSMIGDAPGLHPWHGQQLREEIEFALSSTCYDNFIDITVNKQKRATLVAVRQYCLSEGVELPVYIAEVLKRKVRTFMKSTEVCTTVEDIVPAFDAEGSISIDPVEEVVTPQDAVKLELLNKFEQQMASCQHLAASGCIAMHLEDANTKLVNTAVHIYMGKYGISGSREKVYSALEESLTLVGQYFDIEVPAVSLWFQRYQMLLSMADSLESFQRTTTAGFPITEDVALDPDKWSASASKIGQIATLAQGINKRNVANCVVAVICDCHVVSYCGIPLVKDYNYFDSLTLEHVFQFVYDAKKTRLKSEKKASAKKSSVGMAKSKFSGSSVSSTASDSSLHKSFYDWYLSYSG